MTSSQSRSSSSATSPPVPPRIAIVGRPNVGKSSLLNMLANRRISIVDPTAGVTRDRVRCLATLAHPEAGQPAMAVELIDTGGFGIEDAAARELSDEIQRQITLALAEADMVLLVIDAQAGLVPLDQQVARLLREHSQEARFRAAEPVLLIANKVDDQRHEPGAYEAANLGMGEPVLVSAVTRHLRYDMVERLIEAMGQDLVEQATRAHARLTGMLSESAAGDDEADELSPQVMHDPDWLSDDQQDQAPEEVIVRQQGNDVWIAPAASDHDSEVDDDQSLLDMQHAPSGPMKLAIVGKRNAGKSTLINALAGEDRVIVSEIEGTTRDSVDVLIDWRGQPVVAIDTAGVRKRKSIQDSIEFYSYHRALRSIRRADVVVHLVDATVPVSQVDRKLAAEIVKHYKPVVLAVSKWDLAENQSDPDAYAEYLDKYMRGLSFAPLVLMCAPRGEGIEQLLAMADNLYQQAGHRIPTGELNQLVNDIITQHQPKSPSGKRPRIFYVTQLAVHPPTIALFVNDPDLFDSNYQRFLMNRLRDAVPFSEVPIKLVIRQRSGRRR